jgi:integrase
VLRVLQKTAHRLDMTGVDIHTMRHNAAVLWFEDGVHIKAVSDLLGNASIAITADIYGHTTDAAARAAITGLAGRLGL